VVCLYLLGDLCRTPSFVQYTAEAHPNQLYIPVNDKQQAYTTMEENSENASPHGASLANGSYSGDMHGSSNGSNGTLNTNNMANGGYPATTAKSNGAVGMANGASGPAGNASTGGPGVSATSTNGVGGNSTIGGKGGWLPVLYISVLYIGY